MGKVNCKFFIQRKTAFVGSPSADYRFPWESSIASFSFNEKLHLTVVAVSLCSQMKPFLVKKQGRLRLTRTGDLPIQNLV
jgi:hypothetical protein